jgi:hypothetical protein
MTNDLTLNRTEVRPSSRPPGAGAIDANRADEGPNQMKDQIK